MTKKITAAQAAAEQAISTPTADVSAYIQQREEQIKTTKKNSFTIKPLQSYPDFLPTTNKRYLLGSYRVKSFDTATREYVLELDETYSPKELRIPEEMQMVPVDDIRKLEVSLQEKNSELRHVYLMQGLNQAQIAHQNAVAQQAGLQGMAAHQNRLPSPEQIRAEIERLQKLLSDRKQAALHPALDNPNRLVSISRTYDGSKFFYEDQS